MHQQQLSGAGAFSHAHAHTLNPYFGYGSNLWQHQMIQRCPTSTYLGVARLPHYRWIINDRGYANVVQLPSSNPSNTSADLPVSNVVYGLVYDLRPADEDRLDVNEGVPYAYTKERVPIEFWRSKSGRRVDVGAEPEVMRMLVYVDRGRVEESKPKREYVYRMNMGISDALDMGVPNEYVEKVVRRFVPAVDDGSVESLARRQALDFQDER